MSGLGETYWYFRLVWCFPKAKIIISSRTISSQNDAYLLRWETALHGGVRGGLLQLVADCILYTGIWILPVCSVNQRFPWKTCLKLFNLSVRSLEGNFSQQINGFSIPPPYQTASSPLSRHMLQLTHPWPLWADPLSALSNISMYRSVCLEYCSLSLRYLENTGASAVLAAQAPCWSMSYLAELLCHFSYSLCSYSYSTSPTAPNTDKGLLQVQSTSKNHRRRSVPKGSDSLFFAHKCWKRCADLYDVALPTTKQQRNDSECHTCLNGYLIRYSCYAPCMVSAWIIFKNFLHPVNALLLFWCIRKMLKSVHLWCAWKWSSWGFKGTCCKMVSVWQTKKKLYGVSTGVRILTTHRDDISLCRTHSRWVS